MTMTQRPQRSFTETHHGPPLLLHVIVSLVLWYGIYAVVRALVLS